MHTVSSNNKIAAIHDLSGFGRGSLTTAIAVLSAMGFQCCPMPTAYLSAHTAFPKTDAAAFLDMTGQMRPTAAHWKELGIHFRAIYSGFLGSLEQVSILQAFIQDFRWEDTLVLIDPVMGDDGAVYRTYTAPMCAAMKTLVSHADVITPNLTEAAILLDEPYDPAPGREKLSEWLRRLSGGRARSVVITGIRLEEGRLGAACFDRADGQISFPSAKEQHGRFAGTGDLFASVLLGNLLSGKDISCAAKAAVDLVGKCIAATEPGPRQEMEGVTFEPLLKTLL